MRVFYYSLRPVSQPEPGSGTGRGARQEEEVQEEGAREDQEVQGGEGEQDPLEHVAPYRARPGPRPPQAVMR